MWVWLLVLLVIVLLAAFVLWKTRPTDGIDWSREAGGPPAPPEPSQVYRPEDSHTGGVGGGGVSG